MIYAGREFRAVFIGTSDITSPEGKPLNPTKTMFDPRILNTSVTRSKSLVVAVGNPYLVLHMEKQMTADLSDKAKCWSHFMKQCLECNTFHFSDQSKETKSNREACRSFLFQELFGNFKTRIEVDSSEEQGDSILKAYKKELENIYEYRQTKITLDRVSKQDISWITSNEVKVTPGAELSSPEEEICSDSEDQEDYLEKYDCTLNFSTYREAEAVPINAEKKIVTIRGSGNRIGAFDGDTFEVGVFRNNPDVKCYGRALTLKSRGGNATFICRVSHHNPIIFYPIDRKNPKFINLPRISRDFLLRRDKDAVNDELKSTDVVVFDHKVVEAHSEELKIPPIKQIIPHNVANEMLFIVAYLRWKRPYRSPLGIVIGALPKGYTSYYAERLLKVKHGIAYDDDSDLISSSDAPHGQDSGYLYDRAFTIDPENAQNLDDAVSLVRLRECESPKETVYELGVHIVNCARYIQPNEAIDREAKIRGVSVYGKKGKIMQMLPAKTREMLSLQPNKIRDVLSVVAIVIFDTDDNIISTSQNVEIKPAQIRSCMQLTYMDAQVVMDGNNVPCLKTAIDQFNGKEGQLPLSLTLQHLYKIATSMRKERLKSNAAYCYDLNEYDETKCWQTHLLIEELMIWANFNVAKKMYTFYPHVALLRRQTHPNMEIMNAFLEKNKENMGMSLALSSFLDKHEIPDNLSFVLPIKTLSLIREAINSKNLVHLSSIIFSNCFFPQLAAPHSQLRFSLTRAEYCCTDENDDEISYQHYSLKLDQYTHFTSPLRRYLDIEVQRMLMEIPEISNKSFCDPEKFKHNEHQDLCSHLNRRVRNANQFERSVLSVELAVKYSATSEVFDAFIASYSNGSLELTFPDMNLKNLPLRERRIPVKFLGPYADVKEEEFKSHPIEDSTECQKLLRWKMKMTSFRAEQGAFVFNILGVQVHTMKDIFEGASSLLEMFTCSTADPDSSTLNVLNYSATSMQRTITIPFNDWHMALNFVKEPTLENMLKLERILPTPPVVSPVKRESDQGKSFPFANYKYETYLKPHDVIRVWMTMSIREELIAPTIQVVEINPLIRICVQHNSHPAECFSDRNLSKASKKVYANMTEYVQLWEKVLLAEAAEKSVKECRQIIIRDVTLEWPPLVIPSNCIDDEYYQPKGCISFKLPESYVENCSEFIQFNEGDLVCVRYGIDPHTNARAVFHLVIHKIKYKKDDVTQPVNVMMKFIGDNNCRISEKMKPVLESKCELQLISLSTSYQ